MSISSSVSQFYSAGRVSKTQWRHADSAWKESHRATIPRLSEICLSILAGEGYDSTVYNAIPENLRTNYLELLPLDIPLEQLSAIPPESAYWGKRLMQEFPDLPTSHQHCNSQIYWEARLARSLSEEGCPELNEILQAGGESVQVLRVQRMWPKSPIDEVLTQTPNIRVLDLAWDREDVAPFGARVDDMKALARGVVLLAKLDELSITHSALTADHLLPLIPALRRCPVGVLDLSYNSIDADGLAQIGRICGSHSTLRRLTLVGNPLGQGAGQTLASIVAYTAVNNLRIIDVSETDIGDAAGALVAEALSDASVLVETLAMRRCGLSLQTGRGFARSLRDNQCLTLVDFRQNQLDDTGVGVIAAALTALSEAARVHGDVMLRRTILLAHNPASQSVMDSVKEYADIALPDHLDGSSKALSSATAAGILIDF